MEQKKEEEEEEEDIFYDRVKDSRIATEERERYWMQQRYATSDDYSRSILDSYKTPGLFVPPRRKISSVRLEDLPTEIKSNVFRNAFETNTDAGARLFSSLRFVSREFKNIVDDPFLMGRRNEIPEDNSMLDFVRGLNEKMVVRVLQDFRVEELTTRGRDSIKKLRSDIHQLFLYAPYKPMWFYGPFGFINPYERNGPGMQVLPIHAVHEVRQVLRSGDNVILAPTVEEAIQTYNRYWMSKQK